MRQQENLTIRPVEERDLAFLQLAQTQGMRGSFQEAQMESMAAAAQPVGEGRDAQLTVPDADGGAGGAAGGLCDRLFCPGRNGSSGHPAG